MIYMIAKVLVMLLGHPENSIVIPEVQQFSNGGASRGSWLRWQTVLPFHSKVRRECFSAKLPERPVLKKQFLTRALHPLRQCHKSQIFAEQPTFQVFHLHLALYTYLLILTLNASTSLSHLNGHIYLHLVVMNCELTAFTLQKGAVDSIFLCCILKFCHIRILRRQSFYFLFTGLGKTKRKTSTRDASPTPSTDAEYSSNGTNTDRIYDLNIPAYVKFAYVAERDDELSLVKGSRVIVMEKCSDGWWRGAHSGQVGWFPSNYVVEEVDEATADSPSFLSLRKGASISNGQNCKILHVVQTLYPFSSVTEEELNFEKGEIMEVIEKPENDPEWWKCKNASGQIGLVPKNYVVILTDGLSVNNSHAHQISYTGPACTGRFAGKGWYYGGVTRHQAECALNERGMEGDFLIRDSESSPSDFSISLKASGKNKHFKVQLVDKVYCIGQRRFKSMDELVEHYKKAPIFTSEHGEKLYLVKALQ